MVLKQVEATLNRCKIGRSEEVTVGLSGGADSVCLLHCLKTLGQKVSAVHVNHMIRGKEAERDAEFARMLCKQLDIPFILESADVPAYAQTNKLTLEQAARELRYKALYNHAQGYLAVAHNLNDQAETVILRLARGTGSDGLRAMQEKNGKLIRPLLNVSRGDIEAYCAKNGLLFVTDSTNLEDCYSRNAVRLKVLPELERVNPGAVDSLVRASELISRDADFINECLKKELWRITQHQDVAYIDITNLGSLHFAISSRLLREAIARIDSPVDIEYSHISSMLELLNGQKGRAVSLPRGLSALYSGNMLVISKHNRVQNSGEVAFQTGVVTLGDITVSIERVNAMGEREENCEYLALDDACGVVIRHRREGDVITPYGAQGSKSLKKYLIDKKVPLHKRDSLVLLAKQSRVLAVIGMTVDRSVAVQNTAENIYKIKVR